MGFPFEFEFELKFELELESPVDWDLVSTSMPVAVAALGFGRRVLTGTTLAPLIVIPSSRSTSFFLSCFLFFFFSAGLSIVESKKQQKRSNCSELEVHFASPAMLCCRAAILKQMPAHKYLRSIAQFKLFLRACRQKTNTHLSADEKANANANGDPFRASLSILIWKLYVAFNQGQSRQPVHTHVKYQFKSLAKVNANAMR